MKCQPICQKCEQVCFSTLFRLSNNTTLGKNVIFCWFGIPRVVQKETMGEVGSCTVI